VRTHLDKVSQIGLAAALVEMCCVEICSLHRNLQIWSSCWARLLPITCAYYYFYICPIATDVCRISKTVLPTPAT